MNQDVVAFLAFVRSLPLELDRDTTEFGYANPVLILADTVLSINRRYDLFVVPRIRLLEQRGLRSLDQLERLIREAGVEAFSSIWNYRHPQRVETLHLLTRKFITLREIHQLDDLATMRQWASETKPGDWSSFEVRGIGFTTYQYLRMLCGADTVKPDRHIQRAVTEALSTTRPLVDIVAIIEEAASHLRIPARQLDHALWRYYAARGASG